MTARWVRDAALAFVYFTLLLTPYMVFVVDTTLEQYGAWVLMQMLLVPPLGAGFAWLTRMLDSRKVKA